MLPVLQAFRNRPPSFFASSCTQAGILVATLVLGGCGVGGFSLEKAEVDRSLITSGIPEASTGNGSGITADQVTIRNAVSAVDMEEQAGKPLAWANTQTGARGSITDLSESRREGKLCRAFTGSRETFDGVSLFKGETCMVAPNLWLIESFTLL